MTLYCSSSLTISEDPEYIARCNAVYPNDDDGVVVSSSCSDDDDDDDRVQW